jgi:hypothetical protein
MHISIKKLLSFLVLFILLTSSTCETDKKGCQNPIATNYDPAATVSDFCACKFEGINTSCGVTNPATLSVTPVRQETEVWCWLAVGEMIFRYYQLPNVNPGNDYQCGIVGAVGYSLNGACDVCNMNCGNCVRPAGSPDMITRMLTEYPKIACRSLNQSNVTLKSLFVANYLTAAFLVSELDAKRPVIAGINPGAQFVLPGNSQHVALIVGYYYTGPNLILRVNDPFPYFITGTDPYVANGAINNGNLSYQIPYANFVNGLRWNTCWYNNKF